MGLGIHKRLGEVHLAVVHLVCVGHCHAAPHVVAPGLVKPEIKHIWEQEILLLLVLTAPAQLEQRRGVHLDLKMSEGLKNLRQCIIFQYFNLIRYPEIRLPLDHVAQDVRPALGRVLDHPLLEGEVPDVELGDLSAPGLTGVEAPTHAVLVLTQICHSPGPGEMEISK